MVFGRGWFERYVRVIYGSFLCSGLIAVGIG
jgi:hypothetical protein